jgi:hypothetical protein
MPQSGNFTLPGVLIAAIVALFGVLTKMIAENQRRNANGRTDAANRIVIEERARYDKLLERLVTVVERVDENLSSLYTILDGHLRYTREVLGDILDRKPEEPPAARPPVVKPRRREGQA